MLQGQSTAQPGGLRAPVVLETLRERGDHYTLATVALNHLDDVPGDSAFALLAFQSYIALGLIGPARELLRDGEDELILQPEVQALRRQIARAPSGRVAWGSLQANFESNTTWLYDRYPEMREHEAVFDNIPREYELYRTFDGNLHVAKRLPGGRLRWLPDLSDVKGVVQNAKLPHDLQSLLCGPYLVAGDRLGMLFNRVFEATQKMFLTFCPRIYVLETDVAAFGTTLYVADWADRLGHKRAVLFVGPDCVERLTAYFEDRPLLSAPQFAVRLTATGESLCDQLYDALKPRTSVLEQRACRTQEAMHGYYDSLPSDHWRNRFHPDRKEPLRVLGLTSRFTTYLQYSMRDWGAAFADRGHEFRVLLEDNDHDLLPSFRMAEVIEEFKPDLVICIDHFRHEYSSKIPANVPFVGWIQDALPHLYSRECGQSLGRLDYYIARDARPLAVKYNYPIERGLAWPMVTNEALFSTEPMAESDLAPYRCDFSFVSSHSKPPERSHEERRERHKDDPATLRLVDRLFEAITNAHATNPHNACAAAERLYRETKEETRFVANSPEADDFLLTSYVYPMAELIFRQNALEWVARYCDRTGRTLCLYGNGWEEHPRFCSYARGFAANGQQLRAIYQASKINLQITTFGAVHQRLLDGLAAGGFFLIRATPSDTIHVPAREFLAAVRKHHASPDTPYTFGEMPQLDEAMRKLWACTGWRVAQDRYVLPASSIRLCEDLEASGFNQIAGAVFERFAEVSFRSPEQFEQLAERYLGDADERAAVAAAMRETVVERFTYGGLVDRLLSLIGEDLLQSAYETPGVAPASCP